MSTSINFRDGKLESSQHHDCTVRAADCASFLTITGTNDSGNHCLFVSPTEAAKLCKELTSILIERGSKEVI